jgi:hypothetical protein
MLVGELEVMLEPVEGDEGREVVEVEGVDTCWIEPRGGME